MKKFCLYIFIIALFIICSCGTSKRITESTSMYNEYEMYITKSQLDSICVADTLGNIEDWISSGAVEFETNQYIKEYMYIKNANDSIQIIYTVHMIGDSIRIAKRINDTK